MDILAASDGVPHNTITPIARRRGNLYELDLVLRNNRTTDAHPLGLFHPHAEVHHIKKENIGLIEVMGLAVLPARLKAEMKEVGDALVKGLDDISANEKIASHADWYQMLLHKYPQVKEREVDDLLQREIGAVFETVLTHAGVYKRTEEGLSAFDQFVDSVSK